MFGDSGQFHPQQPIQFMEGLLDPIIGSQGPTFSIGALQSDTVSRTTYTFTVDIGAADDARAMHFLCTTTATGASTSFSSGTIAGASLANSIDLQVSVSYCTILSARVPASAGSGNQTLSITLSSAATYFTVFPYRSMMLNSLTPVATLTSSANPGTGAINVSERGLLFATARQGNTTCTYTWAGVNEDFDATIGATGRSASGGSYQAGAAEVGRTVTATRSAAGNNFTMVAASFR
ncbi:MAG: hypothetical protein E5X38_30590 [Mesorhizobium sp.]|uniref:hypothetical protein n=1 Tax=Mesorhizobium sp. TaxID=1871066 RepID=UPI000FEA5B69|nr:hypothetical protein [Mesorhizobium sp.]RWI45976.1 MAG: hypothetical protein EOQ93_30435 [Mesorhizobium sp.]TIN12197.1 MAG: hypothetical protein E5Y51_28530 [Mesorhizobium sp.]TIQ83057.1 MAG: hypothetical protein E5X38_30590 [Mesorhizobium sp.]